MNETSRPLVSFVLVAYRQEQFIRAAVEAAFRQSYSPLEIILSDDCSPDNTFKIMQEMAGAYQGPHQVRLNRNERNLGLGGHINRCMDLARGELIVGAAGDDISLPHRTEATVAAWIKSNRKACSIYADAITINEQGQELGWKVQHKPEAYRGDVLRLCRKGKVGVPGCTHAWHRSVFEHFGPLNPDIFFEDGVIPLRSRLLGEVEYIPETLVQYRVWNGSIAKPYQKADTVERYKESRAAGARQLMAVYRQWRSDFGKAPAAPAGHAALVNAMNSKAEFSWAMQQPGFQSRFVAFLKALRHPTNVPHLLHWYPICASSTVYAAWIRRRKVRRNA
jgi:glycosyltransferase involved in cell wall biosynthesis